jgi:hypothetical protein
MFIHLGWQVVYIIKFLRSNWSALGLQVTDALLIGLVDHSSCVHPDFDLVLRIDDRLVDLYVEMRVGVLEDARVDPDRCISFYPEATFV